MANMTCAHALAPSAKWSEAQGKRHKTLADRARQAILQSKRWLADRHMVVVADSSFAALGLIAAVRRHVCLITRLRLDKTARNFLAAFNLVAALCLNSAPK